MAVAAIAVVVSIVAALEQFLVFFLLGFFGEIARMFDEVLIFL